MTISITLSALKYALHAHRPVEVYSAPDWHLCQNCPKAHHESAT